MQKDNEVARPSAARSPSISPSEGSLPNIEDLTLNDRTVSVAETNDENTGRERCSVFEPHFFKRKPIDKRNPRVDNKTSDNKKKHNYQKKVEFLQSRVEHLQREIESLRRRDEFCPQCRYHLSERNDLRMRELIQPEEFYHQTPNPDEAGSCQRSDSKESVEFEKINFMSPLMMSPEMEEKSWIFAGALMMAMGSKITDVDGTVNVFKVLKESVDSIRRQVDKCQEKINMDFFLSKEELPGGGGTSDSQICEGMNFDPFFAKPEANPAGFQLEGVKLEAVDEYDLFYDQKISYSVKYEALLTVMEYLRDHSSVS